MNRIGTDIVEVARIQDAVSRTGEVFLNRVYTKEEQVYCESRGPHRFECYAARFAAKEALAKALGTGIGQHASLTEIEVVHDSLGKPALRLLGGTLDFFTRNFPGMKIDVSLSHTANLAIAIVLISA